MAKDPSFPFYSQDFITGTMFMSNEQVGVYVRLLCAQHQHGGLIDKKSFDAMVGPDAMIRSKFEETDDGFFNKRLMEEMIKREKKSCNLSANAKRRWDLHRIGICKSNAIAEHRDMPPENENSISIRELNTNRPVPPKFEISEKLELGAHTLEAAEQNQFRRTGARNTSFVMSQWAVFLSELMVVPDHRRKIEYPDITSVNKYFLNWLRKKIPEPSGINSGRQLSEYEQKLQLEREKYKGYTGVK